MIVRRARRADIPALAAVAERSYRMAFKTILASDALQTRTSAFFQLRFEAAWDRMWVAGPNGEPVGFCLMTDGHIDMLFVDPESAGRGVGAALLRQVEGLGARSLECFRDNQLARRFYEIHGWVVEREYEREFLGSEHAFVLMVKKRRDPTAQA